MGILYVYTASLYLPVLVLFTFYITPRYPIILFFFTGAALAWLHQNQVLPQGFPDTAVIPYAQIEGTIASIPVITSGKAQFLLEVERYNQHPAKGLVQLAWYNKAPPIHAGEHWHFTVKLKKARNFLNPGSFDYVTFLLRKHIVWTGYVRTSGNHLIKKAHANFDSLRERLGDRLSQLAPNQPTAGVVEALTLNLTRHISQNDWELFRRTGTIHLFGISGEHIALISGLVYWLTRWLWTRSAKCCLYIPAPYIASSCGLLAALFYAFLAGFEPPVQRALIGCFFYTLCSLGKQRFTPWQVWRYALLGVLCLEPHAVFMQGFYFSFLAVACILLTQQRWQLKGYKATLALQLSCLIGLMPLTLYWYSYGSINGYIANLLAIPLVGFLIMPLALITMLLCLNGWAWLPMNILSWLISLLFTLLQGTEHLAVLNFSRSLPFIELATALMGAMILWILLPVKPFHWLVALWLIIPLFPPRINVPAGEALVHVLDVGQGLAVAIHTRHHLVLYDTGDQFIQGSDLGKMVILPYFKTIGVKFIDTIIISHPDKDHRGGLESIEADMPVGQLVVNDTSYYGRGVTCHNYPAWEWDGVQFRFFPIHTRFKSKNNDSCVLQVRTKAGKVLLTGDIEKPAEDYLIRTYGSELASEILIVPHHGSKTSSSYRFLMEVAPQHAIASLGFDNHFHFPHTKTLANMHTLGISFYRTDQCGMTQITVPALGEIKKPSCYLA